MDASVVEKSAPWQLRAGDEVIAEIRVTGGDFPWLEGRLLARPGFEKVRSLFTEELRLREAADEGGSEEAWDATYWKIRQAVTLHRPDGSAVPEFLLHIDGDVAGWRWSDEPFES